MKRLTVFSLSAALLLLPVMAAAQTRISMTKNKYSVQDDIKIGRDAAKQVEQQMPILNDREATAYVTRIGERLVAAIPRQFRQPAFDYTFKIVNASDINAFALPGGPMFVDRGMIEAAKNEGEMAGVMAHEISHVALRHATAQATKTEKYKVGSVLGQIAGAIIGGGVGQIIGAGSQIGFGIGALKYSREFETQADILGSQIMAAAGYDSRDLANMFRTIENQGGSRAPQWLSSHPDPGNRYQKINAEAKLLDVSANPIKVTREFSRVKERLSAMPPAPTMAEIERGNGNGGESNGQASNNPMAEGRYSSRVAVPSTRTRIYNTGGFSISVPANWREFSQTGLIFAPEGGYGDRGITHGVMIGVYDSRSADLARGTQDYLDQMLKGNSYLRRQNSISRTTIDGRRAYTTTLSGTSPITRRTEVVKIYTVQRSGGDLLYITAVAPASESYRYDRAFRLMLDSIRLGE